VYKRQLGYTSLSKAELSTARVGAISEFFLGTIDQSLNALLLVVSSLLIVSGNLTTGTYAAINVIIGTALEPIRSLSQILETFQNSRLSFQSAAELLPAKPENQHREINSDGSELKPSSDAPAIQLVDLSFKYSKYSDPILSDANLSIRSRSGRPLAIRLDGDSGSGKSTLLNVLMGLLQPTSGKVLINGIDLSILQLSDLRQIVQYVDRSALIAFGSVETNARLGTSANHTAYQETLDALGLIREAVFSQQSARVLQNESSISTGQAVMISLIRAALMRPKLLMIDESLVSLPESLHQPVIEGLLSLNINVLVVQHGDSPYINTLPTVFMHDLQKGVKQ